MEFGCDTSRGVIGIPIANCEFYLISWSGSHMHSLLSPLVITIATTHFRFRIYNTALYLSLCIYAFVCVITIATTHFRFRIYNTALYLSLCIYAFVCVINL